MLFRKDYKTKDFVKPFNVVDSLRLIDNCGYDSVVILCSSHCIGILDHWINLIFEFYTHTFLCWDGFSLVCWHLGYLIELISVIYAKFECLFSFMHVSANNKYHFIFWLLGEVLHHKGIILLIFLSRCYPDR